MKPTEELYYKYAGVITSVVKRYAWKYPELEDELYLQAQLVFCQACLSYEPEHESGASFETWLRNQLKSITSIINRASRGPNLINSGSTAVYTESAAIDDSMSRLANNDMDTMDIISDIAPHWYLDKKSDTLLLTGDMEFPKEMQPYIDALKGDALQIFQDFCNGEFELEIPVFATRAKKRYREILNPLKLYRRRYRELGWTLDRVKSAWRSLHGILSNYLKGSLPVQVTSPDNAFMQALLF